MSPCPDCTIHLTILIHWKYSSIKDYKRPQHEINYRQDQTLTYSFIFETHVFITQSINTIITKAYNDVKKLGVKVNAIPGTVNLKDQLSLLIQQAGLTLQASHLQES
jgi:hypothetical protein